MSGTLVETPQAMVAVWGSVGALLCCLLLVLFAAGATQALIVIAAFSPLPRHPLCCKKLTEADIFLICQII